jgi:hypothetical protein
MDVNIETVGIDYLSEPMRIRKTVKEFEALVRVERYEYESSTFLIGESLPDSKLYIPNSTLQRDVFFPRALT